MSRALIGRSHELADIGSRIDRSRLVTIVGPGGVGKTALAHAAAARYAERFPLGVRVVDLTRVADPAAVPGALAAQLGFDSFDALIASPADRPVLLLVDNCEHLLDATAAAVAQVLGVCHQPTVLATSRSPLELPGETVVALAPLPLPKPGDDPATSPPVELFLERCRDAGVEPPLADLAAAAELCRRLDGLPLAIEIAAARTRTMTIAEIVARLDQTVDVLDRPRFRGDPRHRGVATAIRWSCDLLSPSTLALLEQLAVFAGPFTREVARAVAGDTPGFDADLDDLVHASLVSVDTDASEARYRLLDMVRRYALDRLAEGGRVAAAYDRFVDHAVDRARTLIAGAAESWRPGLLRELAASYEDFAEALRWCIAHDEDPRRAHRLCSALWAIVHQGRADEIADLMRRLLERFPDRDSAGGAQAVAVLATALYVTGHPAEAVELASSTLADHPGPDITSVTLRRVLGQARNALGDPHGAIATFREGSEIGHRLGMTAMAHELEIAAAMLTADLGDTAAALAEIDAIVDQTAARSALTATWASAGRAWITVRLDPAAALAAAEAGAEEARRIDFPVAVAVHLRTAAFANLLLGDLARAGAAVSDLVDDLLERGALSNLRILVDVVAALAHRCGHPLWEQLVATARALPITTVAASHYEVIPLPQVSAAAFARQQVIAAVRQVVADLPPASSEPASPAAGAPAAERRTAAARELGDMWELDFHGRTVAVRSSKGLADIVRLIEAGGREIHCTELAGVAVEQSSTGAVIDDVARRQYEDRIRELQAEIDAAEAANDYARSYRYQVELDTLIEHLASTLDRRGRTRRGTDTTERARSAVTHRVRSAIRQLCQLHPALGHHLEHAVNTGVYCSYRPEHETVWTVQRASAAPAPESPV